MFVSAASTSGPHTETGNITVPGGATLGNTMMRVVNVETSPPSGITACGTYSYGETEDYLVNIIEAGGVIPPTVTTTTPSSIGTTTATSGGEVTLTGGEEPFQRGVCWSTLANPTTADSKTEEGPGGLGTFTSSITGLTQGSTYHVRAYAENSAGISYGSDLTFTTTCPVSTLPFSESFTAATFPQCWTTSYSAGVTNIWSVSTTNYAGGTANEMLLGYQDINPGTARLILPAINTTGKSGLSLSFKQFYDDYGAGVTMKIQTSTDKVNWTDETWSIVGGSGNQTGTVSTLISNNLNSANTYIAFVAEGNLYQYDGWAIDDISVQEAVNNDISVEIMYAKGKVPFNYGANDVITAVVKNVGAQTQTGINVTLDISNANTFNDVQNIASLAPGASTTVTFSEFVATGTGTDNISVSVPNDDNNANNSKTFTQEVTANTIAYSDGAAATISLGFNTGSGTFLTKYHATGSALVNSVNVFISNEAANTGNTVYGVVINTSGTIIGQSANYVIQATDLGTWKTFNITTPPDVSNLDYYAGMAQTANATTGYFPLGTQTESPGRPAAYYSTPLTGGAFTNYTEFGRFMIEAVMSTPVGMTYVSSTTSQTNGKVYLNSTNQQIMALQVVTTGTSSPLSVTDFALNTTGTDNPSTDITNAKIFYTGTTNTFATTTPYGSTVAAPNGVFNITGSQILAEGTNYFWLTYDIPSGATNNNKVDAQCTGITIGTTQTPTVTAPPEFKTIAGTMSGSYAIGSGTFNKVTGKNLYQVEKTRTVKVLVPEEEKVSDSKGSNKGESETKTDTRISYVEKEVEEKYYEMYEGDKPYEGKLFVKMSEVQSMSKGGDPKMSPNVYDEVFADIPTAITELNSRGITGPVTFEFTDATYTTSAVTINAVTGASATNTITFKPQTGENVLISGSTASSLITLNGADYVTFDGSNNGSNSKNLTIRNEIAYSELTFINGATNNTIKNITFEGANNTGIIYFGTGANTNNSITGCDIRDRSDVAGMSAYGIYFNSTTNDGNNVTNCNIYNFTYYGIYLNASSNTLIESCNIYNATVSAGTAVYGIYIGNAGSTNIYKNKIYNLEGTTAATIKGIYYFGSSGASMNVNIINNVIILSPTTSGNIDGIDYFGYTANSLNIYNNSIYIGGSQTSGSSGTYGIRKRDAATTYNQKNNVIVNGRTNAGATSPHYAIYVSSTTATTLDLNYNDYYSNGTGGVLGFWSATNQATISAWRTASSRDAFSISGDPGFTSTSNLQPDVNNANCWNINAGAYPLATVSSDINGNTRNTNLTSGACDIGAYEFTPSAAPIALGISNNFVDGGLSTITFAGIPLATITWHVTGGNTLPSGINAVFQPGVNPSNTLPGSKFANENFEITATGGSGYTYDIVYSYNTARQGTIGLEAMFRLTKYSSGTWTQYSTAPNEVSKTITVTGLNSFSVFTFGDGDAPLPVTLSSFTSSLKGRDVTLAWKTESENNNAGFDVERKQDGTTEWKKAGFVAGKGTMNSPVNYTFEDKKLNSGKYNYRLKQIDNNGNYEYHNLSTTIDVSLPTKFNLSQNYPNPFNPTTKIDFDLPFDSKVSIMLYDMTGREIKTLVNEARTAGYHTVQFNASELSSGTYFYRIITKSADKDFVATKKMVLIK